MIPENNIGNMRLLLDLLSDKWTVPVLGILCANNGRQRFNALRRDMPSVSQKSLVSCLRRLEAHGLVMRHVSTVGKLAVEYQVTSLGHTLEKPVEALLEWSVTYGDQVESSKAAFRERFDS